MTGTNIGFALYAIGERPGTLDARWSYENAYSGSGLATGGPNQGFVGNFHIRYFLENGEFSDEYDLQIRRTGDLYDATWLVDDAISAVGVGMEVGTRLAVGWRRVTDWRLASLPIVRAIESRRLASGSGHGFAGPAVLLHDVDIPVRAAEEEPAEAFHARVAGQFACPHEISNQLHLRCGHQFRASASNVVNGERDDDAFAHLVRKQTCVVVIRAEDFDKVTAPRRQLEHRPRWFSVPDAQSEYISEEG